MDRLQAAQHYYFGDSYYKQLWREMPGALNIATVRDSNGNSVASALVLCDDNTVHYHLSGSNPTAARQGANNLLIWTILEWAVRTKRQWVHLGGGVKPNDGLFAFKDSFGGKRLPFRVGRLIVNPTRYDTLVDDRALELGCNRRDLLASGYFPAYRAGAENES